MKLFTGKFLPFWAGAGASILVSAALQPVTHPFLKFAVFAAPAIWTLLALRQEPDAAEQDAANKPGFWKRLGRRFSGEYMQFWYAHTFFWLITLYWVSYPHPATILGWIALAMYLGIYLPLFMGSCRALHKYLRFPVWLASPICWVACEWLRNRGLGGFSYAGLSHAVYDDPALIQIAEILGEYGVSATIVLIGSLVGCAIADRLSGEQKVGGRKSVRLISFAAIVLFCTILFGRSRVEYFDKLEAEALSHGRPTLNVGLLQDSTLYTFPPAKGLNQEVSGRYRALARKAVKDNPDLDLIIWPEGTYYGFFYDADRDYSDLVDSIESESAPSDAKPTLDELRKRFPEFYALSDSDRKKAEFDLVYMRDETRSQRRNLARMTAELGIPVILGTATAQFDDANNPRTYNSAIYVPYLGDKKEVEALVPSELTQTPTSTLLVEDTDAFRRYDKIHLVLFGEYIPFVEYLPDSWGLKSVCAQTTLSRGSGPTAFRVSPRESQARFILAPNVCFESVIPQFIKNQIEEMRANDCDPDILINVSFDGWFRRGIEVDLHLATHVYRAIENRRSVLTATHAGFSAWIDPAGRIRSIAPRGEDAVVRANVPSIKGVRLGTAGDVDIAEAWSLGCAWLAFGVLVLGWLGSKIARAVRKRAAKTDNNVQ